MKKGSLADLVAPVQIGTSLVLRDNARLRSQLDSARERIRELECLCIDGSRVKKVQVGQVWCDLGMADVLRFYKIERIDNLTAIVRRCALDGKTTSVYNKVKQVRVLLRHLTGGEWVLVKEAT